MNEDQFKKIEDLIVKAVQSGKQETSGLVEMVIHKIEPAIEKAVEKHVNGKIRAIDTKIDIYIKEDLEWKSKALPVIDSGTKVLNFGTVGVGLLKFVTVFGVAFGFIWAFIKYILK